MTSGQYVFPNLSARLPEVTPPFAAAILPRYPGINKEGNNMTNTITSSRSRIWSVLTTPPSFPQKGPRLKINKWFFYIFYPAHLALIALVRNLM